MTTSPQSPEQRPVSRPNWPDPQPLPVELPPVPAFDCEVLPAVFSPWVEDIAERLQCPPEYPAVGAMVALASVVGRKIGIRPKQRDDWLVVPNLWGAVVGPPSVMKSPALREPMKPLQRLEIEAKQDFDSTMQSHEASRMVAKERKKVEATKIREAIKDEQDADAIALSSIERDSAEPIRRRFIVNDITVEKLGEILNQNPFGVLMFRDELSGFLKGLERQGQEPSRAFFLEAWDGRGRFVFDRIGRGTIDIETACVSVLGGIQPGPLSAYVYGAVDGGRDADGLLQRFQMMVYPDISPVWRNVDEWPNAEAKNAAYEVFAHLDHLDPTSVGAGPDDDNPEGIPYLRFDGHAQRRFNSWRSDLEHRLRREDEHPVMVAHLAKYRSLIPSLALLIHLADGLEGPVGIVALNKAIRWGKYLELHARRIYAGAIEPEGMAARLLAAKIEAGKVRDGFALRDVYRHGWTGLTEQVEATRAVSMLMDLGWLHEEVEPTKGRPKTSYFVNPKISISPPKGTDKADRSPKQTLLSVLSGDDSGGTEFFKADSPESTDIPEIIYEEDIPF